MPKVAIPVSSSFKIPKDFESHPEFRWLESDSSFALACAAILVLFRELAYLADAQRFGFVTRDQMSRVVEKVFKREGGTKFEADPIASLVGARILFQLEDGFECRIFMEHNMHLTPGAVNATAKGTFFSGITFKRRKYEKEAQAHAAAFDRARFVRPDGTLMNDDEMRVTTMLIKLIDNQFSRNTRRPDEYSLGLIADSYHAINRHSEEMINGVCFCLSKKMHLHDANIPLRTEDVLREMDRLVSIYGPVGIRKQRGDKRKKEEENHGLQIKAA